MSEKFLANRLKYHTASRVGAKETDPLLNALNRDQHTVHYKDVWTSPIEDFPVNTSTNTPGSVGYNPDLQEFNFKTTTDSTYATDNLIAVFKSGATSTDFKGGKIWTNNAYPAVVLYEQVEMTPVVNSNGTGILYESYEVLDNNNIRLMDWVSPLAVFDPELDTPVPGYAGKIEVNVKNTTTWTEVQKSDKVSGVWDAKYGNWEFVYSAGMAIFNADYTPTRYASAFTTYGGSSDTANVVKLRWTGFLYTGDYATDKIAVTELNVVTLTSNKVTVSDDVDIANTLTVNEVNVGDKLALHDKQIKNMFAGVTLSDVTNLDTYVTTGITRITNNIVGTKPPIRDCSGFLQVMDIDHDDDTTSMKNYRRVRQIIYPDNKDESTPYSRVGTCATLTGTIDWSEWTQMGGGSLRRVVTSIDVPKALNNVMYEVFTDNLTITLPAAESVPVGTKIGVEQYIGNGLVVCGTGDDRLEQITECDIEIYEPEDVTSPTMVTRWTSKPSTVNAIYGKILEFSGSDGLNNSNTFTITESGDIDGVYTLVDTSTEGQVRVWKNGYVYCYYDTVSKVWKFVRSEDNFATISEILYQAEYAFKSADALCYIFECVINEEGNRDWILDVDNNFAKAVDILSGRITHAERRIDKIDDNEPYLHLIRTRTTKSIMNPTENELICDPPETNATIEDKIAKLRSSDRNIYFYDFIVSVTQTCTINLPTTNIPLGAVVCIEVIGNCSVTVVAGSYSDTYVGSADEILVCEFEYTSIGVSTHAWTVLSLAGTTPDPVVPVLSVVTPVDITGLTENVAMDGVQLQASVENGDSSDIVFTATSVGGFSVSTSGMVSGTPTVSGNVSMNVEVSYPGALSKIIVVNFEVDSAPDEPDPIVPVLTVVTPVNVTGLTKGVAMTPVQLSAYVENGLSSDIGFYSTDIVGGLTLSSTGLISGTPTVSGNVSMNVVVSYPGAESKIIVVNFDINAISLTELFASVNDRVTTLEEDSALLQTRQEYHETDPAAHSDLMADVATVDEANTLRTAINELIAMIEEKENSISQAQRELNNIVTTLRYGDVSTLESQLGVPITIPLTDSDGVTRDYRIMMTSINTDDTPGYERNARFEFLDVVDTRAYDDGSTSWWPPSDIRTYLTSEAADGFMVRLPKWLRDMIVPTNIECTITESNGNQETFSDKVFLPSAYELCGMVYNYKWFKEGAKSTYYPTADYAESIKDDKKVRYNLNGTAKIWWTRSPSCTSNYASDTHVVTVNTDGGVLYGYPANGTTIGIAPAFVIA